MRIGRRATASWRRASIPYEARQLRFCVLSLVPHGDSRPLDLVILKVADGNPDPPLGAKSPFAAFDIGEVETSKMARIVGVGIDEVNVTGDLGQPREQGVAVAMAAAAFGLLTPARKDTCQHGRER